MIGRNRGTSSRTANLAAKTESLSRAAGSSGCEKLDFSPTIDVKPDGDAGSTPTGLNVHVHVPQEATDKPVGLGEADVKDTTVALPAGVQISPSAADGLQACSNAQIGLRVSKELDPVGEPGVPTAQFTGRAGKKPRVPGRVEDRDRAGSRRRCWKTNWKARCISRRRRTSRRAAGKPVLAR